MNEIKYTAEEWKLLNSIHTPSEIIKIISDDIDKYQIPFPLKNITKLEAVSDFENLKKLALTDILRIADEKTTLYTKYPYKYALSKRYLQANLTGNVASDYFHQKARMLCDSINSPSPYRIWTTEQFRKNMLKGLWSWSEPLKELNATKLRSAIAMRGYTASQFRPSAARAIYQQFESRDVLDLSMGWGDRFAAFCSLDDTRTYFGCDPNKRLIEGLSGQLSEYGDNKIVHFNFQPAEDTEFGEERFDTVFTSPPYFDTERYNTDESQSWKRYKGLDNWLNNFLFEILGRAWTALKPNGFMAINIADVYAHHRINNICDPMNDFIAGLPNAAYCGAIGYKMSKRPNSDAHVHSSNKGSQSFYVEPIWVWKKVVK
jgi:hypothetical protein